MAPPLALLGAASPLGVAPSSLLSPAGAYDRISDPNTTQDTFARDTALFPAANAALPSPVIGPPVLSEVVQFGTVDLTDIEKGKFAESSVEEKEILPLGDSCFLFPHRGCEHPSAVRGLSLLVQRWSAQCGLAPPSDDRRWERSRL